MLKTLLLFLLVLLLLLSVAVYLVATHMLPYALLQPEKRTLSATPADYGLPYDHLRLPVADSIELDAFFVPAGGQAKANLIMIHGVGSCKEVYLGSAPALSQIGYNIFLVDMRQHGKSGGQFITYGYHEKHDISKILDWLEARTNGLKTGIYGNSMGGAVAIQSLAHDDRLAFGLIESTFTDLPSVANAYGRRMGGFALPFWLSNYVLHRAEKIADFKPFTVRPLEAAASVKQPIQHIHGDADANINVSNAHALFAAYVSEDKQLHIVPNGDHADLWDKGGEAYRDTWFGFLRRMVEE